MIWQNLLFGPQICQFNFFELCMVRASDDLAHGLHEGVYELLYVADNNSILTLGHSQIVYLITIPFSVHLSKHFSEAFDVSE